MKKNITLMHFAYPPYIGGVEVLMREHALILQSLGYHVTVITGSGGDKAMSEKVIQMPELQSLFAVNKPLYTKIVENGIIDGDCDNLSKAIQQKLEVYLADQDVIIVHNMFNLLINIPFIYALKDYIKRHPDKKIILWVHDHPYLKKGKILKDILNLPPLIHNLITQKQEGVTYVTISETLKKLLIQVTDLKDDDLTVIPNGIDVCDFLEIDDSIEHVVYKHNLMHSFPFILAPLNLLDRKNVEYSIDILPHLKKVYPQLKFVITGRLSLHRKDDSYFSLIKQKIQQHNLEDNVLFLYNELDRFLSKSELHDFYKLCDCIFYFSKSENFGLPLLEAGLSNKPIYVSDLDVFHEVGQQFLHYINYRETIPEKAAVEILQSIKNNKGMQFSSHIKNTYDLKTIIKDKLLPLLD